MYASYLNLKNTHFLFGGLTSAGLYVLGGSLKLWDKDTGYPSTIIKHNMRSEEPYTVKGCVLGVASEHGIGSNFKLTEFVPNTPPIVQFSMATFPNEPARAVEMPFRYILKGMRDLTKGYMVYLHTLQTKDGNNCCYYGITSRHWIERLKEHEAEAVAGSPLLFHRALRDMRENVSRFVTTIIAAGKTKDEAYDIEEHLIAKHSLYPSKPNGLNMIPGGYEGIRWLGRMGAYIDRTAEPEARDAMVKLVVSAHPRLGNPNSAIAMRWQDDDYAEAVICGRENRLSAMQVRQIRMLAAEGYGSERILQTSGATSTEQVKRILSGRTYRRIK